MSRPPAIAICFLTTFTLFHETNRDDFYHVPQGFEPDNLRVLDHALWYPRYGPHVALEVRVAEGAEEPLRPE